MIEYEDLLGVPYIKHGEDPKRGLDCLSITRILLDRAGIVVPAGSDSELVAFLNNKNGDWVKKDSGFAEGDVVLMRGSEQDPYGVGVVVRERPRVLVATSLMGKGTTILNNRQLSVVTIAVFSYRDRQ